MVAACGATSVIAQTTYTYVGPLNGDWNAASNWSPMGVPGSGVLDEAFVPSGSATRFALSGVHSRTIQRLGVAPLAQLEIMDGFDLIVRGDSNGIGSLTIPGTLLLSSMGGDTGLSIGGGAVATFGGGSPDAPALIEMSNSSRNYIRGATATERLIVQPGAVIRGAGLVGVNTLAVVNQGQIRARGSAGLEIDPPEMGMVNMGLISADTGPVRLVDGAIDNSGGTIIAVEGDVLLVRSEVFGGVLNSSGGAGAIRISSPPGTTRLHDLANQGVLHWPNGRSAVAYGTIANSGTIRLESTGDPTSLLIADHLILTGAGALEMSDNSHNRIGTDTGLLSLVLINAGSHTIVGSGEIGIGEINIVNYPDASILAEGAAGLTIRPSWVLTNLGTLGATRGSSLHLDGGYWCTFDMTAPAIAQDGGTIYLESGTFIGTFGSVGSGECVVSQADSFGPRVDLVDFVNIGRLAMYDGAAAHIGETITNDGVIVMHAESEAAELDLREPTTLVGSGSLEMSGIAGGRILSSSSGSRTFTNASTIIGSGQIGVNSINIVNEAGGSIRATGPAGLIIDPLATMHSAGEIRAEPGSRIEFPPGSYVFERPVVAMDGATIALRGGSYSGSINAEGTGRFEILTASSPSIPTTFSNFTNPLAITIRNTSLGLAGNVTNTGTLNLTAEGAATTLFASGVATIDGGGRIVMSNTQQNVIGGGTFTNVDNTITGAGRITASAFVNGPGGTIAATLPAGIFIGLNGSSFINNGQLRAEAGSSIRLEGSGVFQFNAPAIAGDGAAILLGVGTISGSIGSEGSGEIRPIGVSNNCQLANLTNLGTLTIPSGYSVATRGSIVNEGIIAMNGASQASSIIVRDNTMLTGEGTLTMSNSRSNIIRAAVSSQDITFDIGQTIEGAGQIGFNSFALRISPGGSVSSTLSEGIELDAFFTLENNGQIRASGGNILVRPTPTFTSTGSIIADAGRLVQFSLTTLRQNAGVIVANGEVQVDNDELLLRGGRIVGTGLIDSSVDNTNGIIAPGSSTTDEASFGVLSIEGNYTQSVVGATRIDIDGPALGTEHDQLAISGTANLGGLLRIRFADGFDPGAGDVYDIVTASSITGGYDSIMTENVPPTAEVGVSILSDRVRVTVGARCPADFDRDGGVTGADIGAFFADYEQGQPGADLDQDGGITGNDIAEFFSHYEAGC